MIVHRAYKHKLALSSDEEALARRIAGCCRFIYNSGLEQRKLGYTATGRGLGYKAHTYHLKEAKAAAEFAFLREAPAHCLQQALKDLDDAYQRFFKGQNRYPKPRRRGENDSFRFPDPDPKQIGRHEPGRHNQVRLPKLGWVRVRNCYPRLARAQGGPRLFEGELKSVTVSRRADGWYVSFACEVQVEPVNRPEQQVDPEAVGIDRGIANSVALSTGELCSLPTITDREWTKIGHLQSVVNRRQKGSRNRERAKWRLARYRRRLVCRKHDALHKLTSEIVERFPVAVIEDLRVRNMSASAKGMVEESGKNVAQKAGLTRSILDQCWYEMERQLAYKYQWSGGELWKVPAYHSSNECRACGQVDRNSRESQAVFRCTACGHASGVLVARARAAGLLLCEAFCGTLCQQPSSRQGSAPRRG